MKNYLVTFSLLLILVVSITSFVFIAKDFKLIEEKPFNSSDPKNQAERKQNLSDQKINKEQPDPVKKEVPTITSATIAGVGDMLIANSIISDAKQNDGSYDFKPMFELVKPYISQADIAFANQETILGGLELGLSGYPRFNSPFQVGDALLFAGFDVLSLANNHTLDMGEKGILNAINYYNSTDLVYTGAYQSKEDQETIRIIEKNGIDFSFLAYSYGTNGLPVPSGKDYLINLIDVDKVNEAIKAAKKKSDVVVLSLHFGNEYELLPNDTQKMLVNEFAQTGADIIFGHHPHVLQPLEWIEKEDGTRTFVAYSLGNFLSGQVGIEREIGGIVQLQVEKTVFADEVSIKLKDPRFLATFSYKKNWRNYKIYPLDEINDATILKNASEHLENTKQQLSQWMPELKFDLN
ncbi:CapA family protein [Bacillaceae bacterium IKA-2]|nr:CapA family protein [Bacillaceae bacterium IKA-2]